MTIAKELLDVKEKESTKSEVKFVESEERQTTVHCYCPIGHSMRIWRKTYLIEHNTGKKAKLITAYNITFAPVWTKSTGKKFTLIFEGLSKDCNSFDLIEMIPLKNKFVSRNINRNISGVYYVNLR